MRDVLRESRRHCFQTFEESTLVKQFLRVGLWWIKFDLVDYFRCFLFIEAHYPLELSLFYAANELELSILDLLRRLILHN